MLAELNERSREVFRRIVDAYVKTGEPVGSRTISRLLTSPLSPASIRNVMADLEETGLLHAPHTSSGRLPTEAGLRLYVDGLLEAGNITADERADIDSLCAGAGRNPSEVLSVAVEALSGLSCAAGLVTAPKTERPFKHVELVPLGPGRALVVVVADNGLVENRVIELPVDLPASSLVEAGNYLTARLAGRNFAEAKERVRREIESHAAQLDALTQGAVEAGLATWANNGAARAEDGILIVRGRAKLLDDVTKLADLERIRQLFEALESKRNLLRLLDQIQTGAGVQVFIGSENPLFNLSGCSMIVAPYRAGGDDDQGVVGAIGVIGPTRVNYARIVPMVDYTAQVVSRMLGAGGAEAGAPERPRPRTTSPS